MDAEAKARRRAKDLCDAAETFRRTGGVIERKETVKALPPDVLRRIELLESQHLQTMQAMQVVLQALEDERAQRELIRDKLITIGEWADERLRKTA